MSYHYTKHMKKKTKQPGQLIYGVHPIVELLKAKKRKLITLYTTKPTPKAWHKIERLLPSYPVSIQYVSREVLNKMADGNEHQSIVALVQPPIIRKKFFDSAKHKFLIMLDSIQDSRNVGAILRSAYCTGAEGIIICKKHAAPLNAAVFKASAGLAEHLEIYVAPSPQAAVHELKQAGYHLYMAAFKGENAATISYQLPLCLVIGNEAIGITRAIVKEGIPVTLPQKSSDISYNASVAAGIILFLISIQHKLV